MSSPYDYPAPSAFDPDAEEERLRRREALLDRYMPRRREAPPAVPDDGRAVYRRDDRFGGGVAWAGGETPPPVPRDPAPPAAPLSGLAMGIEDSRRFFSAHPEYSEDPNDPQSWRAAPARDPRNPAQMAGRMDLSPAERALWQQRERRDYDEAQAALDFERRLALAEAQRAAAPPVPISRDMTGWLDANGYHDNPGYEPPSVAAQIAAQGRADAASSAAQGRVDAANAAAKGRADAARIRAESAAALAAANPWAAGGGGTAVNRQTGEIVGGSDASEKNGRYTYKDGVVIDTQTGESRELPPRDRKIVVQNMLDKLRQEAAQAGNYQQASYQTQIDALTKELARLNGEEPEETPAPERASFWDRIFGRAKPTPAPAPVPAPAAVVPGVQTPGSAAARPKWRPGMKPEELQ